MKTVDYRALKNVKFDAEGYFAKIFSADVMGKKYCYKILEHPYDPSIMENIINLTDEDFPSQYLIPLFMIEKNGKILPSYLSDYCEGNDIIYTFDDEKKLEYLKQSKKLIEFLHKDLKFIHGDLSNSNIMVDELEDLCYISDFDSAVKIGQEVKSYETLSTIVCNYLKYHKFDEKVDIFKFNLTTLSVFYNIDEEDVLEFIMNEELPIMDEEKEVNLLCKELLLYDTKHPYSGEYIIDYL